SRVFAVFESSFSSGSNRGKEGAGKRPVHQADRSARFLSASRLMSGLPCSLIQQMPPGTSSPRRFPRIVPFDLAANPRCVKPAEVQGGGAYRPSAVASALSALGTRKSSAASRENEDACDIRNEYLTHKERRRLGHRTERLASPSRTRYTFCL